MATGNYEQYLKNCLAKYKNKDVTKREVLQVFTSYSDLKPNLQPHIFNDGSRKDLLTLEGTIPVQYRGTTYNIPVCMYLMETHPFNPPLCYVRPTATMEIKTGKHVDSSGRVYLPYLHEWKHPKSDLIGLIEVMRIVFGEEPPVFAKSAASHSQQPAHQPYPMAAGQTPYPVGPPGGGYSMPMPSMPGGSTSTPYPSYPPSTGGYQPPSAGYPAGPSSYPTATTAGYPGSQHRASISEDTIRASLLSAVNDKLRRRMRETFQQAQAEMDALKRTEDDLKKGQRQLDEMIQKLGTECVEVDKNVQLLKQKDEEIKEVIAKMESQSESVDIDEAVVTTAPLYKQLVNLFAEENAIEDTIYYLGEALRKGVIDLEVFLKHVRELSRKQYMCRALIQKARKTAGLGEVVGH
ncbi:PREDICTED: tumor susceptibility gene 101 protein-like [Branchiostoma belcheri]|uniref:Tumor susceptibility gene 101 protein-like n=1 Tax=Branchiostoma belcheri TaxID=7741 RepID=A0A6P4XWN7_BRABE|nr:PREDICTED: tumor susceptibility gene 101 protein-like [Branchiostoma belcheri]